MKTLLLFLIMLSVIIIIHEGGHLLAAKKFGVYCYEFSIGMGPVLWKKQTKETQYSLRALPLGGFVSMAGEIDGDEAYPDVEVPDDRRLINKPWWQKCIIMLAGIFMNFILAFLLFSLTILCNGGYYDEAKAVVGNVQTGSPAEIAGLQAGDKIIKVESDGKSVYPESFTDLVSFNTEGKPEVYTIERNSEELKVTVTPSYDEENQRYLIGIYAPEREFIKVNFLTCWVSGAKDMVMLTKATANAFSELFKGIGVKNLSGPVGIYQATKTYSSQGLLTYLLLIAQISFSVGFFNLLPLPVLDGGQVVITLIEALVHRRLNTKVKMGIMLACWAMLILMMIAVTYMDITKLFS